MTIGRGGLLALLLAAPLTLIGQRAQIGVKGRTPERRAPGLGPRNPEHILPRRVTGEGVLAPDPNQVERERQRGAQPAALPMPEDRTHVLVRSRPAAASPTPLPAAPETAAPYLRPRRLPDGASLAGLLPVSQIPPPAGRLPESPVPSRWRIQFPTWRRYEDSRIDALFAPRRWWDPFNRNPLKGDYPVIGRKVFLSFTGSSDTLAESRRVPTASGASSAEPGSVDFFGRGGQFSVRQDFRLSLDLFRGSAGFKPVDWELRFTPQFNINYLLAREVGVVNIDVRQGIRRTDDHAGIQELFFEKRLGTNSSSMFRRRADSDDRGSPYYDFTSMRMGIQRFTSDFRGFIFSDEQPGLRLFGNFRSNRFQYNLAYFNMLEKDTNSGLNLFERRHQSVYVANLYWQDFVKPGYTAEFSLHYNNDQPSFHIDRNGFLVRPQPIGDPTPHKIRAGYAGFAGDGHMGRINVSNAFYQAFGRDDFNPIAGRPQHINAQLAALELSYDRDWLRYKASFFFASGDNMADPGQARGFDSIVDNQNFAGGGFLSNGLFADRGFANPAFEGGGVNLFNRQAIPLTGTGVNLVTFNSLMPTLRTSKDEGQANFVNPGIVIFNAGAEAKITPKLRSTVNVNYLRFHRTEVLEALLFQSGIRHEIGWDLGTGLQYRPWLSENIVVTGGFGVLKPGDGFKSIYTGQTLYSGFVHVRLLF